MSYWQLPEDMIYGILGIEPSGSEYVTLPSSVEDSDCNRQTYYEALENEMDNVE